ncbi:hypothetical protein BJ875DRAFT_519888 [Amylocarpus encephaloides]|uniref:Helix-turn-helix domain-containing protein n=1 Tax=Amylocarpus encephaloides TaxID=45428 RepID=A0A9P8C9T8_9HELO|nr:hypothetical protein BJ875DRAFT_519888 [Amylocarpus encephaloides]
MGSASSKASAASKSIPRSIPKTSKNARKYPTRSPPRTANPESSRPAPGPTVRPGTGTAVLIGGLEVENHAADPQMDSILNSRALNRRLQQLGPVQPNPTQSNSSTFNTPSHHQDHISAPTSSSNQQIFPSPSGNPAVSLLTARYRLAEEAEREFEGIGKRGGEGRSFLDVGTLRQVLILRDKGMGEGDIERALELKGGVVGRLGRRGVVGVAD